MAIMRAAFVKSNNSIGEQGQVYKAAGLGKRGFAAAGRHCFPLFTDAIFRD